MPTYQYACTECGEPLEVVQKFTDDPLTECPACHGRLRKVFNSVGIVFKGSGFYRTDSRDSKKSTDAASPSSTSTAASPASSESSAAASTSASTSTGSSSDSKASASGAGKAASA